MSFACARARRALLDQSLDRLAPAREADLARHIAACPSCAKLAEEEALLSARLGAAGRSTAPPVDVRERVLRQIGTLEPAAERPRIGWAVGLGLLAAASHAAWSIASWPEIVQGLGQTRAVLGAGLSVAREIVAALVTVGVWVLDLAQSAARALGALAPLMRVAAPVVTTTLVVLASAATATIAIAVARDLARGSGIRLTEER